MWMWQVVRLMGDQGGWGSRESEGNGPSRSSEVAQWTAEANDASSSADHQSANEALLSGPWDGEGECF